MEQGASKDVTLRVRITRDENEAFALAAQKRSMKVSEWIRSTLEGAAKGERTANE